MDEQQDWERTFDPPLEVSVPYSSDTYWVTTVRSASEYVQIEGVAFRHKFDRVQHAITCQAVMAAVAKRVIQEAQAHRRKLEQEVAMAEAREVYEREALF